MVVDTSAIMAVLLDEPEKARFVDRLTDSEVVISGGTLIELLRVARLRRADAGVDDVWQLVDAQEISVVPVDLAQARLADDGQRRFGKGRRRPPAVLDLGDLFAYALARHLEAPLLFKGDDFSKTDVKPALAA